MRMGSAAGHDCADWCEQSSATGLASHATKNPVSVPPHWALPGCTTSARSMRNAAPIAARFQRAVMRQLYCCERSLVYRVSAARAVKPLLRVAHGAGFRGRTDDRWIVVRVGVAI